MGNREQVVSRKTPFRLTYCNWLRTEKIDWAGGSTTVHVELGTGYCDDPLPLVERVRISPPN